jgi:hypothetical protein
VPQGAAAAVSGATTQPNVLSLKKRAIPNTS